MFSINVQLKEVIKSLQTEEIELRLFIRKIMLDFTKLTDAVTNEVTVEQSAITLITTIAGEIAANANDQQTVSDLADKLNQAAITANTPTAPAATPVTAPVVPVTPVTPA
jgi:hypothetical protein